MNEPIKKVLMSIELPESLGASGRQGIARAAAELAEKRLARARRRRLALGLVAVAFAGCVALGGALWNTEAMASIRKALDFVPGIGVMKKAGEEERRLVLKEPVKWQESGSSIDIVGVSVDDSMTLITMNGQRGPWLVDSIVLLQSDKEFTVPRSMAVNTTGAWTASYWYNGKLELEEGRAELLIRTDRHDLRIPLMLEQADAYASYEELGPTATVDGISVTAVVTKAGDKTRVYLTSRHSDDFRISSYGVTEWFGSQLSIRDDQGMSYEVEQIFGISAPADDFYVRLSSEPGRTYTLTIPGIAVTYWDKSDITLAAETRTDLNRTIELGGLPLTITGTEMMDDGTMRVYVDTHYDENSSRSLATFRLDGLSHMAQLDKRKRTTEFIQFDVKPGSKKVKLAFSQPEVIIRGPWVLDISGNP